MIGIVLLVLSSFGAALVAVGILLLVQAGRIRKENRALDAAG